jgi:hypothetical protein
MSLGGTVALGVSASSVRAVLALDPLLHSEGAAYAQPRFRAFLAANPGEAQFLREIFGLSADRAEARDYGPVLDQASCRAVILAGGPETDTPSVLRPDDLARLRAHPRVTLKVVAGVGHDISMGASSVIISVLRALIGPQQQDQHAALPAAIGGDRGDSAAAASRSGSRTI